VSFVNMILFSLAPAGVRSVKVFQV